VGDTVEFLFREHRDLPAAKRFFKQALDRHGRPDHVVIDGSQTNREAIISYDATNRIETGAPETTRPNSIRRSKYLNNRIEQDHSWVKHRVRPMLDFRSEASARIILSGIKLICMMRKRRARFAYNPNPSLAEQFALLAA
ncbi:MAG: IS6 family transposase, partial [Acetobacteraceae bacterium]|nr:IS6 family transposase [Acetobacteraceae bacterium]